MPPVLPRPRLRELLRALDAGPCPYEVAPDLTLTRRLDTTALLTARCDHDTVTEQPDTTPTVHDRLLAAGLTPEAIAEHHDAGRVRLDGEPITGLDQPAPIGTRPAIWPS